ncbi:SGNH/GDSL hydrolase family protein, partial [Arthrospira platensis SPKY1]|nr:SGNH/GDSL hydrolase family protein [Arthrospira platensis SPKY1]
MLDGMSGLASFYFLDVFSIFNDVLDNPADYGFVNTTGQCRSVSGFFGQNENSCANPNTWAFWDAIHPTTAAHQVLGLAAADLLINGSPLGTVPEPSVLLLLALALAL